MQSQPETPTLTSEIEKNRERHQEKPIMLIVESYILDTLGHLGKKQLQHTKSIVHTALGQESPEHYTWQDILKDTLGLADEFDSEIKILWEKNRAIAIEEGLELTPEFFAQMIADDNFGHLLDD